MAQPDVLILGAAGRSVDTAALPAFYHWKNQGDIGRIVAFDKRWPDSYREIGDHDLVFIRGDALNYSDIQKALSRLFSNTLICYCALPPHYQPPSLTILAQAIQASHIKTALLALEKPVGLNFDHAESTMRATTPFQSVCYVDHYLGKLVNSPPYIDPTWIGMSQKITIEGLESDLIDYSRLNSWNNYGILGDMVQSHLLQLLALVVAPQDKTAFIQSLYPIHVTLGTYETYEARVERARGLILDSVASTFADINLGSLKPNIPNIQIVTGKGLKEKRTQVNLFFEDGKQLASIALPSLSYRDYIPIVRGMLDVLEGGTSNLFVSPDEILASWSLIERLVPDQRITYRLGEMLV